MFKIHSFPEKTPQNSIPEIYLFLDFELLPLSCSSAYIPEHVYYPAKYSKEGKTPPPHQ